MALAILLFLCFILPAQHFSRTYYDNRPFLIYSSLVQVNKSIYLTGVTAPVVPPYYLKGFFNKVDDSGQPAFAVGLIDSLKYSYEFYWNNLKQTSDGNLIASGEMIDTAKKIFIMKIDTLGNVLFWKQYADSTISIFNGRDIIEIPGQGYLIIINAAFINGNNADIMVYRTDLSGNILNKKVYGAGSQEAPCVARKMLNGNYLIGGTSIKTGSTTPFWCRTWLLELDSFGNMANQWLDTDATNLWVRGMQQTADSGWIIVRQHLAYDVNDVQGYNASIIKLDKSFNKQWEIVRGDSGAYTGLYDIEILPDGKYIACGTVPTWGHDSAYHWGWIVKIDTGGTIIWDRKYLAVARFGTENYLNDIDILPNGDLLACGELRFGFDVGIYPTQQGWILRTDSNGCVIDNCLVSVQEASTSSIIGIKTYPNPTSAYVLFESTITTPVKIEVYDLAGRIVTEKEILPLATLKLETDDWASGVYTWKGNNNTTSQFNGKIIIARW